MAGQFDDFKSGKYCLGTYNLPDPTEEDPDPSLPTPEEFRAAWEPVTSYGVFQLEEGGKENRLHYQFYFEFKTTMRISAVVKIMRGPKYLKRLAKDPQVAANYCKKRDETYRDGPWEWGEISRPQPGNRTDWSAAKDLIRDRGIGALIEDMPEIWFKYASASLQLLARYKPKLRDTPPLVELHIGRTGAGKTRNYFDNYYDIGYEVPHTKELAVNGYENEEVVLIDEYNGFWPLTTFLTLIDRYPRKMNCKYGFAWWYPQMVLITSNLHPRRWYDWTNREEQYSAMMRRIGKVILYNSAEDKQEMNNGDDAFEAFVRQYDY